MATHRGHVRGNWRVPPHTDTENMSSTTVWTCCHLFLQKNEYSFTESELPTVLPGKRHHSESEPVRQHVWAEERQAEWVNTSYKYLYTYVKCAVMSQTNTHARTNSTELHPSHHNCRARSPSRSTGAPSLTTDIILIAHRGQVVCPHSHPDSLCAENPTTENSG